MHRCVALMDINHATYGDRTHLLKLSRWKPAGGGDHGEVFFRSCAVCVVVACGV